MNRNPWPALCACVLPGICGAQEETAQALQDCARIEASPERLACYDRLAQRSPAGAAGEPLAVVPDPPSPTAAADEPGQTRLERYWELQEEAQRGAFVLLPFRPNYVLPASYNFSPNQDPFADSGFDVQDLEVKFQFSFKFKLWQDIAHTPVDLWFGYTQQSYWQLWNQESSPFRETNYEPTVFAGLPVDRDLLGLRLRMLTVGFTHQSNGRGEPLSRSWNRIVGAAVFERGHLIGQVRAWYRIPEDPEDDDNPDILRYLGYGDLSLSYVRGRNEWSTTLKNPTRPDKAGIELGWSFPLGSRTPVRGYVQYYYGYGESLLDYDNAGNRLSVGFLMNDWF
jgi:phospholipase A1/A2